MSTAKSPLDEIRAAEREIARRVEEARKAAAAEIERARVDADRIRREAKERGRNAAQVRFDETVRTAQTQAEDWERKIDRRIAQLEKDAAPRIQELTDAMVELVLEPPGEKGK